MVGPAGGDCQDLMAGLAEHRRRPLLVEAGHRVLRQQTRARRPETNSDLSQQGARTECIQCDSIMRDTLAFPGTLASLSLFNMFY